MTPRRFVASLLLLPLALLLCGCAALEPNHVTVTLGRDEAESAGDRRTRTVTNKVTVSATYDLPRP